ncbi:extracellular solute-binding protein [Oribacterium sp. NK2B42]|uniref:extracellular solute-binding protein n=1 Tax=Oribacterium sp. NK2B42 TaxID=689781 RepID=UPI0004174ECE|nr:extracellular solute-binding protein [Oribacterium sp. NK2B42]
MKRIGIRGMFAAGMLAVLLTGCGGTTAKTETEAVKTEAAKAGTEASKTETEVPKGSKEKSETEAAEESAENPKTEAAKDSAEKPETEPPKGSGEVNIYTAVDQVHSEKIFKEFEEATGIKVNPVYDLEANKTTGLTNKILTEMEHPLCDVFWNNEFAQTIELQKQGALAPYVSPVSADIPDAYKDKDGYWTAFGGRARTLLVNKDLLEEKDYPKSIFDLTSGKYEGDQIAIAYPMFGTTRTQAAAIYAALGAEKGKEFFQKLKDSGVQVVDGNSVTKDMAASGQVKIGYTDTDDAKEALEDGANVEMCFTDQEEGGIGNLITPNTAAIIKGAPNEENAKIFIDYIISLDMEKELIDMGFFDLSIRPDADVEGLKVKGMNVNLVEVYDMLETASNDMQEIFSVQ